VPIVAVPRGGFPTAEARRALPDEVTFADAQFTSSRAALLVASITTAFPGVILASAAVAMAGTAMLVGEAAYGWSRRFLRSGRVAEHVARLRERIEAYRPEVIAYYAGPLETSYWINQWLPALNRLERRVLILTREEANASRVGETPFPIVLARGTNEVEIAVTEDTRAVLYFGNAGKNVHMLRYPELKHVFLNHGDSDKAVTASPLNQLFDRIFVAAAVNAMLSRATSERSCAYRRARPALSAVTPAARSRSQSAMAGRRSAASSRLPRPIQS
jgi:hypothetical protein